MARVLAAGFVMAAASLNPAGNSAWAQAAEKSAVISAPSLSVELNSLQATDNGCRFTFVTTNNLGSELESAAFELVLFDKKGMVSRMTIVDFQKLPQGKTKVRQFDFSGVDCAAIGRILVNDAAQCVGESIDPGDCIRSLQTSTRTDITFGS